MNELKTRPTEVLTQMANYSPVQVERKFEMYNKALEELDSLNRSRAFYMYEYSGDDRAAHLHKVEEIINKIEVYIENLSPPRSIGQLARENAEMTIDMLALMINDLRMYMIVDRMITNNGILNLCQFILATYPSLTLEEIAVCFSQSKKGLYGEDYQRLDGAVIMRWLKRYVEDKQERLASKHYADEVQWKAGNDVGRSVRGENLKIFLAKATGATLLHAEQQRKK